MFDSSWGHGKGNPQHSEEQPDKPDGHSDGEDGSEAGSYAEYVRTVEKAADSKKRKDRATAQGLLIEWKELTETDTVVGGKTVFEHELSGRLLVERTFDSQMKGVPAQAVILDHETETVAWEGVAVSHQELGEAEDRKRTRRREREASEKLVAEFEKLKKKAPLKVYTHAAPVRTKFGEADPMTLDDVERLVAETGAVLTLARSKAVIVKAADMGYVKGKLSQGNQLGLNLARKHEINCKTLVRASADLGELMVSFVKNDNKRPRVDVGSGKANRTTEAGLWLN